MLRWTVHLKGLPEVPYDAAVAVNHKVYCFRGDFIESKRRTEVYVCLYAGPSCLQRHLEEDNVPLRFILC